MKKRLTIYYAKYLAGRAKEIARQRVAERFHSSWQTVGAAVEWVVSYGVLHRNLGSITALGAEEIAWHKGMINSRSFIRLTPDADACFGLEKTHPGDNSAV